MGSDLEKCGAPIRAMLALYIGGMGARGKNFYNDLAIRLGYEAEAKTIQDLYLDRKQNEAQAAVPTKLIDEVALLGTRERVADRLKAWKASGVTSMLIGSQNVETLRTLAELC